MSACSVSGTSSASTDPVTRYATLLARQHATVEEHADRLDRVERHALGALPDPCAEIVRKPGYQAAKELVSRLLRKRFEEQRAEAPPAGAPGRPPLEQLRARQREHEDRMAPRPLEEVLDEVEQTRVRPVKVFEQEDDRPEAAISSKKRRHAEKRSCWSGAVRSVRPSRCRRRGSIHSRSSTSGTNRSTVWRSFACAEPGASSSRIPERQRTISASAQ